MGQETGELALGVCALFNPTMTTSCDNSTQITAYSIKGIEVTPQLDENQQDVIPTLTNVPLSEILILDPLPPPPQEISGNMAETIAMMKERFRYSIPLSMLAETICNYLEEAPTDRQAQAALIVLAHRARTFVIGETLNWLVAESVNEIACMVPTLALDVKCITQNQDHPQYPAYQNTDPLTRPPEFPAIHVRLGAISNHLPLPNVSARDMASLFNRMTGRTDGCSAQFQTVLQLGSNCLVIVANSAHAVSVMKQNWGQPQPSTSRTLN